MVSQIVHLTEMAGVAAAASYVIDAITPMGMQEGRKVSAVVNWSCIVMACIGIATLIFGIINANIGLICLGIGTALTSLVGAYSVKKLTFMQSIEQDSKKLDKIDSDLDKEAKKYKEQVDQLTLDIKKLETENNQEQQLFQQLEKEKKAWQTKADTLSQEVESLKKIPDKLQVQLTSFSQDVQAYAGSVSLAGKELETLQQVSNALDKDSHSIDSLGNVVQAMQQLMQLSVQQSTTSKKENADLNMQLKALHEANKTLQDSLQKQQVIQQGIEDQIHATDATIDKAKKMVEEKKKHV